MSGHLQLEYGMNAPARAVPQVIPQVMLATLLKGNEVHLLRGSCCGTPLTATYLFSRPAALSKAHFFLFLRTACVEEESFPSFLTLRRVLFRSAAVRDTGSALL